MLSEYSSLLLVQQNLGLLFKTTLKAIPHPKDPREVRAVPKPTLGQSREEGILHLFLHIQFQMFSLHPNLFGQLNTFMNRFWFKKQQQQHTH